MLIISIMLLVIVFQKSASLFESVVCNFYKTHDNALKISFNYLHMINQNYKFIYFSNCIQLMFRNRKNSHANMFNFMKWN